MFMIFKINKISRNLQNIGVVLLSNSKTKYKI